MISRNNFESAFESIFKEEMRNESLVLTGQYDAMRPFGIFHALLLAKDVRLTDVIFQFIAENMEEELFRSEITRAQNDEITSEKSGLSSKIFDADATGNTDIVSLIRYSQLEAYGSLDYNGVIRYLDGYYKTPLGFSLEDSALVDYYMENYLRYAIAYLLYRKHVRHFHGRFNVPSSSNLEEYYLSKGIDLKSSDSEFSGYQLVSVLDCHEIKCTTTPKLYDKRTNSHVLINEIGTEFLRYLKSQKDSGNINRLALRPNYDIACDNILDIGPLYEEVEYGKVFDLKDLNIPSVSKLYSADYSNLWIVNDGTNLTFEEILSDFLVVDDFIVTQVVHLEYSAKNTEMIISHIDHEYIFYTLDQFEVRRNNHKQKGEAKTRYKTFKIDQSNIPLRDADGNIFLMKVLNEFMQSKDLISEYFSGLEIAAPK